jgi:ribosomal protein S27AE
MTEITAARAELIAKSQHCPRCGEYSYKRVRVRPADEAQRRELNVAWCAWLTCGVCGSEHEVGLDDEGQTVYVG